MANRPVTSREYKLMLNTDRFQDRGRGTEVFFDLLTFLINKEGGTIDAQVESPRTQRLPISPVATGCPSSSRIRAS